MEINRDYNIVYIECNTAEEFLDTISPTSQIFIDGEHNKHHQLIFRGQSDASWELKHSVYRDTGFGKFDVIFKDRYRGDLKGNMLILSSS